MAPRAQTAEDDTDFETIEPSPSPAKVDEVEFEQSIMSELGGSDDDIRWIIRVYEIEKDGSNVNENQLFDVDRSDIGKIFSRLRDEYGTGHYRVRVYKNGRIWKRMDMRIKRPQTKSQPTSAPASEMTAVLSEMRAANERTLQMFERFMQAQSQPIQIPDPFANFDKIARLMASMQSMTAPKGAENAMQIFLQGVQFAQNITPDERPEGIAGMLRDILNSPVMQQVVESLKNSSTPSIVLPPPLPRESSPASPARMNSVPSAPVSGEGAAPPPPQETSIEDVIASAATLAPEEVAQALTTNRELQQLFIGPIVYLVSKAQGNSDPVFYADWILDNWPTELIDLLLQQPDPVSLMQSVVSDVSMHRAWFQSVIDELRAASDNEAGTDDSDVSGTNSGPFTSRDNSRRPEGHSGNAEANGGVRKPR